jgi:protein-disulfide isomerase-like protein with CxxC motif
MIFTLESETQFKTTQRLHANGQPTLIFLSNEESATLHRNGPTIDRAGLKSLFSLSPNRLEMLRNIFP